jgi:hypothetical protein
MMILVSLQEGTPEYSLSLSVLCKDTVIGQLFANWEGSLHQNLTMLTH